MLRRINDALPGLVLGIILYGVLIELLGVWFVSDPVRFSSGLWIGIAVAVGMAVHMAIVIVDAVDLLGAEHARKKIVFQSVLRYAVVVAVFLIMMVFHLGNLLPAFVGVMGLKAAAYVQPFIHKAVLKLQGRSDMPSSAQGK